MARFIKSILFLLLVVVLHVTVNNDYTEESFGRGVSSAVSSSSSQHAVDHAKQPYRPDAELGSMGLQLNQTTSSRTQRTPFAGSAFSLKPIGRILAEREAMLFRHEGKVYDASLLFPITHPTGDYYVFALRHIII